MILVIWISTIVAAYLLGSIPSGVIVSRAFSGTDVRRVGSGHIGTFNTVRAAGLLAGVLTLLADASKAVLAVDLARVLTGMELGMALAGVTAVVGHCWPIYTRGQGGMGLTPAGASLFVLDAPILIVLFVIWFPLKYLLKTTARASMGVALLLTPALWLSGADASRLVFGLGAGLVLFVRHWTESRRQPPQLW